MVFLFFFVALAQVQHPAAYPKRRTEFLQRIARCISISAMLNFWALGSGAQSLPVPYMGELALSPKPVKQLSGRILALVWNPKERADMRPEISQHRNSASASECQIVSKKGTRIATKM